MTTKEQDMIMRDQLEKAYEEEKLRSALIQRCYRIYHEFLQTKDEELYNHLMKNEVNPELHLMRWLRCCLSREFDVKITIDYWDYIIGGLYLQGPSNPKDPFPPQETDPFLNLDIVCVSMIISIRETLLESDFSMCLAYLLNFEQPDDPSIIITQAIKIKNEILEIQQKEEEEILDFEAIDADPEAETSST